MIGTSDLSRPKMNVPEGPSIVAALEQRVRGGAGAGRIAEAVAATWGQAEASLTPIIGPLGMAALCKRSLALTARSHPWIGALAEGPPNAATLSAFTAALAERQSGEAARAGGEFLQKFHGLVSGLIGPALTHRLLRFMWQPL